MKLLRGVVSFLLNLVPPWGTGLIVSALHFPARTMTEHIIHEDLLSALVAANLGFLIYSLLKPAAAKWVWVFGLCWLAFHAVPVLAEGGGTFRTQFSGMACASHPTPANCREWLGVTLPFMRTVFYSAGAFCCSRFRPDGSKGAAAPERPTAS